MLITDEAVTEDRREALRTYLSSAVDDGRQLVCTSAPRCRASMRKGESLVEGQLSHIGSSFDLADDGRPLRVVVVSKQVGGSLSDGGGRGHEHVTIDERRLQVDSAKQGRQPFPRTRHMMGTELALKVLLGLEVSDAPFVTLQGGRTAHVFDCMALVNSTLCSRSGGDASGQGSEVMFELCRPHLAETMRILEPTIVVAQGWTRKSAEGHEQSVASTVASALGGRIAASHPSVSLAVCEWGTTAVVTAYHPARKWFTASAPYWRQLEPVLRQARSLSLDDRD